MLDGAKDFEGIVVGREEGDRDKEGMSDGMIDGVL